jgi:hypothetical protein
MKNQYNELNVTDNRSDITYHISSPTTLFFTQSRVFDIYISSRFYSIGIIVSLKKTFAGQNLPNYRLIEWAW